MFRPAGLVTWLVLCLLAGRVVAVPTPRAPGAISWGGCVSFGVDSEDPNLQCGTLDVPMDYHDSSAGTAHLAVIKWATTASPKLGTIFFNPGGPGGSGLHALPGLAPSLSLGSGGAFDLVSWDPRGVGVTFPGEVNCFTSQEDDATFWANTVVSGINETISGKFNDRDYNELYAQADSTEKKYSDFATRCQSAPLGPYLKYVGTSSTVRDLVSLGDAIVGVGEPIDYWGVSYGTVLGFNFINMFPERVGHVIIDGVVDPNIWMSYKLLTPSLGDAEKTYSGLTDGCAAAGKAGCKLIQLTGDGVSGDAVKTLLSDVHDLALQMYRGGIDLGGATPANFRLYLFNLLYAPTSWSDQVNQQVYQIVAIVLQLALDHNVTLSGGAKYSVPSGDFSFDKTLLSTIGAAPPQNLTSYALAAISGADNFNDDSVTIKNVFDVVVSNTRQVTASFGTLWSLGYVSYKWPTRSVERLPPYTPAKLKNPVLVIGNTADPITPYAGAQSAAKILGSNAFLLQQVGFGHSSLAQVSTCTQVITTTFFVNSKLPDGQSAQCAVDNTNLFPALDTAPPKRSTPLRRWWR